MTDPSGECIDERVPWIGEPGCRIEAGILQGNVDIEGFQQYSADVVQGIGLPGAMAYDAIYGTNHTQRIVAEGGVGVVLGSAYTVALTAGLPAAVAGTSAGASAVVTSLAARTTAYAMGGAYYNAYRPQHPGLAVPGYILGYENIYQDLGTIWDCNASGWQRGLAAGDAVFNAVLGMTMLSGLRNSAQSFRLGWTLRNLSVADRMSLLQRIAAKSAKTLVEKGPRSFPYRPLGEQVIQLPRATVAGNPWKLSGSFYHELTHVTQEFGAMGTIARGTQQLSAWTGNLPGMPLYLINPAEVHAFASGLSSTTNIAGLALSRLESQCLTTGNNSNSACVTAWNNINRLFDHYAGR
jgi:hypothetical protein